MCAFVCLCSFICIIYCFQNRYFSLCTSAGSINIAIIRYYQILLVAFDFFCFIKSQLGISIMDTLQLTNSEDLSVAYLFSFQLERLCAVGYSFIIMCYFYLTIP